MRLFVQDIFLSVCHCLYSNAVDNLGKVLNNGNVFVTFSGI